MPLTAKFATTCGACGGPIQPGEEITDTGGGREPAVGPRDLSAGAVRARAGWRPTSDPRRLGASAPAVDALSVWTDGACSGNPGPGGWAWATKDGRQASGGSPLTTNQRMEIQAALEAVRALDGTAGRGQ